jgi:hypothetical protein
MWNAKIRDYPTPSRGALFLRGTKKSSDAPPRNNANGAMMHEAVSIRNSGESDEGARGFARPFFYSS